MPIIQKTFFCEVVWITPYKLSIFAFCISLIVRPLGGLIFGYIGDRISRLLSLRLSILCMTVASIILAVLPGQKAIGDLAVWMVLFCRLLQGISAGGEYNGASIIAIESNADKANLISGFMTSSAMMGLAMASVAGYLLSTNTLPDYTWRIFVAFGAFIGFASLILRKVPHTKTINIQQNITQSNFWPFLAIFFIGGQTTSFGYFIFVNLKNYLATSIINIDANLLMIFSFLLTAITSVICGIIAQKTIKNRMMLIGIKLIILASPIAIYLLANDQPAIKIAGMFLFSIMLGVHGSCQHSYFQSIIPIHLRQRIISLAFSLGAGILSSIVVWIASNQNIIQTTNSISPYMFMFSLISICGLMCTKNAISSVKRKHYKT
jgi:MHS family proline/betaine transporter-like MFS transporter